MDYFSLVGWLVGIDKILAPSLRNLIIQVDTGVLINTWSTSIDVLPSKNQALCEYCTHEKLKHCADTLGTHH